MQAEGALQMRKRALPGRTVHWATNEILDVQRRLPG
jgi:hypothetical protein